MKNFVFMLGFVLFMTGVALVAISTGTANGLYVAVICMGISTLNVMNKVEVQRVEEA